jgi:hypothetical protein
MSEKEIDRLIELDAQKQQGKLSYSQRVELTDLSLKLAPALAAELRKYQYGIKPKRMPRSFVANGHTWAVAAHYMEASELA